MRRTHRTQQTRWASGRAPEGTGIGIVYCYRLSCVHRNCPERTTYSVCMYVCMCVCVSEKKRRRSSEGNRQIYIPYNNKGKQRQWPEPLANRDNNSWFSRIRKLSINLLKASITTFFLCCSITIAVRTMITLLTSINSISYDSNPNTIRTCSVLFWVWGHTSQKGGGSVTTNQSVTQFGCHVITPWLSRSSEPSRSRLGQGP